MKYWMGRLEFAVMYLEAVQIVKEAAQAEQAASQSQAQGQLPSHRRHMEDAARLAGEVQAKLTEAIERYAGVARNRADHGAMAVLAEFAYRPLGKKVWELRAALDH